MRLILPKPRWETPKPRGVAGSYGPLAVAWAKRELNLTPDPWQEYAITRALEHDAGGRLIHRIVLLSTARQNGKSVVVRIIVGWMMDEGQYLPAFADWPEILLAAHDANQANVVYRKVMGDLAGVPRIKAKSRLTQLYGLESGHLAVNRVTHIPGSARGRSAGLVAWDEMLTQVDWDMWEVLQPTLSAIPNSFMLLTSTAGGPESVILRAFYDRLLRIAAGDEKPDRRFYGAWWASKDPDAGLDWTALRQANPSLAAGRLDKAAILDEYRNMPASSWRKERLNHWVATVLPGAFNPGVWAALRTAEPLAGVDPPFTLALDIQPGWERATIAVAAIRPDGRIGVEVHRDLRAEPSAPITARRLIDELLAFKPPRASVVFDAASGAAAELLRFAPDDWGCEWKALKPNEIVAACMDVTEMILSGRLAVDDPLMDAQVATVARRDVGQDGAFRFSRAGSAGPIDAIMAMTFAAHAAAGAAPMPSIV